ncbi:DUF6233 domain-containing protein [Streptomyces albogriseolus]|uniref:DUF6233 domain-containing protein n=1 Tax=Streptomyces albogriseolus TaxID=1887 RepID=UPI003F4A6248
MWLARIDHKIAELQRQEAEREHGRRVRPAKPERIVQLSIGTGRPPVQVHASDCYAAGNRRRPIDRDEAPASWSRDCPSAPTASPTSTSASSTDLGDTPGPPVAGADGDGEAPERPPPRVEGIARDLDAASADAEFSRPRAAVAPG